MSKKKKSPAYEDGRRDALDMVYKVLKIFGAKYWLKLKCAEITDEIRETEARRG